MESNTAIADESTIFQSLREAFNQSPNILIARKKSYNYYLSELQTKI